MFFCEPCREILDWPVSMFRSRGRCEQCLTESVCYDVPSKFLSIPTQEMFDRIRERMVK